MSKTLHIYGIFFTKNIQKQHFLTNVENMGRNKEDNSQNLGIQDFCCCFIVSIQILNPAVYFLLWH